MVRDSHHTISEKQKNVIIQNLWLNYYVDTALKHGLLNEQDRAKLCSAIKERQTSLGLGS